MTHSADAIEALHHRIARLERAVAVVVVTPPDIRRVLDVVAEAYGMTRHDLVGAGRTKPVVEPRHAAMWLARKLTNHSLPAIGRAIGRRDHTTVLSGIRRIQARASTNPDFAARLGALAALIQSTSRSEA